MKTKMTTKTITRKIAGRVFSIEVAAIDDPEYGLSVSLREGMRADLAIAAALATEGPATPDAFRFMRKALALSGKDAAELLGVTAVTVSRWENEARELDPLAWFALGTLVLDYAGKPQEPKVRMQRLASGYKPPREKHVDL
jgi:DNA-binding transcriptional regulator YiaG